MKRDVEFPQDPPKLVETDHPHAQILARGNRAYATSPEENEHFDRTRGGMLPRSRRGPTLLTRISVAAALLVALALGVLAHSQLVSKRLPSERSPKTNAAPSKAGR